MSGSGIILWSLVVTASLLSELARLFAAEARDTKDIEHFFYCTDVAVELHCAAGFKKQEEYERMDW